LLPTCFPRLLPVRLRLVSKPEFIVLPKAVAHRRREKGLKQRGLAKAIGVAPGTIGRIETGDLSPSWYTLVDIANALDVNVEVIALVTRWPAEVSVA
jgi:DNA-binding XRE family transcriptional regulator